MTPFPITTFEDPSGNPLSNGYVLIRASSDVASTSETQTGREMVLRVSLNSSGVMDPIPEIHFPAYPSGVVYKTEAYTSLGELVANFTVSPSATTVVVPGVAIPWNPALSGNASYPFGMELSPMSDTPIVAVTAGSTIVLSATGLVTFDPGASYSGPDGSSYTYPGFAQPYPKDSEGVYWPTYYVYGAVTGIVQRGGLMGAFTNSTGDVVQPVVIGTGATFTVPAGATQLQLGIDDDYYQDNLGSFTVVIRVME